MDQLRPLEQMGITQPVIMEQPPVIINNIPETHTKEFSIGEMKDEPGKIKIDFFGGERPNDFIKQPTEAAKPVINGSENNYINPVQSVAGSNPITPLKSKEEIRGSMSVLIAVIDYGLSFLGLIIAGEGTQSQYTADTPQKKLLETALTDYFYEKQVKMSPIVALLLAFLGAYGFMLGGAVKKRIDRKKGLKTLPVKSVSDIPKPYYKAGFNEDEIKKLTEVEKPVFSGTIKNDSNGITTTVVNYGWLNPDPKLVAKDRSELDIYLRKKIYPMYLQNASNKNTRKINYDPANGKPILAGKPARVTRVK